MHITRKLTVVHGTSAAPSCGSLGLPATAAISGASYSKCQSFGGTNYCQSSKAPGWDLCPVINGQASPASDPVLSATAAKGVSILLLYIAVCSLWPKGLAPFLMTAYAHMHFAINLSCLTIELTLQQSSDTCFNSTFLLVICCLLSAMPLANAITGQ